MSDFRLCYRWRDTHQPVQVRLEGLHCNRCPGGQCKVFGRGRIDNCLDIHRRSPERHPKNQSRSHISAPAAKANTLPMPPGLAHCAGPVIDRAQEAAVREVTIAKCHLSIGSSGVPCKSTHLPSTLPPLTPVGGSKHRLETVAFVHLVKDSCHPVVSQVRAPTCETCTK